MRIFIYSIFTIFSCNEKEEIDSNDFENEINCVEDESLDTEDTQSAVFSSKTEFTRIQELHYDQQETRGNPLKGFLTNYQWGSPANNFSHSLEFAYIPLSNVIQEEGVFTFNPSCLYRLSLA
jgi:hypothetical protein